MRRDSHSLYVNSQVASGSSLSAEESYAVARSLLIRESLSHSHSIWKSELVSTDFSQEPRELVELEDILPLAHLDILINYPSSITEFEN